MKIIVDEIFKKYSNNTSLAEGYYDYLIDKEDFKQAMKEFAEKLLELAVENATINSIEYSKFRGEIIKIINLGQEVPTENTQIYYQTDKDSITSVINQIEF